jgi:hypothetical protein
MSKGPALIGGILIGAAIWIEVFALLGLTYYWLVIPLILGFLAGLFIGGSEEAAGGLWLGGIFFSAMVGFFVYFLWFDTNLTPLSNSALLTIPASLLAFAGTFMMARSASYY